MRCMFGKTSLVLVIIITLSLGVYVPRAKNKKLKTNIVVARRPDLRR